MKTSIILLLVSICFPDNRRIKNEREHQQDTVNASNSAGAYSSVRPIPLLHTTNSQQQQLKVEMLIDAHQLAIMLPTLLAEEERGMEEVLLDRTSGTRVSVIPLESILLL